VGSLEDATAALTLKTTIHVEGSPSSGSEVTSTQPIPALKFEPAIPARLLQTLRLKRYN
jgi:hypothetical protein